jgi:hypothetical protein
MMKSRNRLISVSLAALASAAIAAATTAAGPDAVDPPPVNKPIVGTLTPATSGWTQLSVVDVDKFPWDTRPRFHAKSKTFFTGPKVGALIYSVFPPTFNTKMPPGGTPPHYHYFHEWGYTLKGDSVLPEPVSPYQKNGMLYRKREGGWLSRPPYSLHGGSWETGGLRAQFPYYLLIMEEGDGSLVTVGPKGDHIKPDFPESKPDPYLPDWKAVKNFTRPWLVDTQSDLEWETDPEVAGRFLKWLSDDMADGFRAQLVKIPPGWQAPAGRKTYFTNANRLRYLISGDMKVWMFNGPNDGGKAVSAKENTFIYQPPRSLWGYGPGEVSKEGAVWLEVTYAKGLSIGGGPLEEPVAAE